MINFRPGAHGGAFLRKLSDARGNVERRNISLLPQPSDHETIMPDGLNML